METLHRRCAGLDVHKKMVMVCVRVCSEGGVEEKVRRFATATGALLEVADWLREEGCTIAAMEATGTYWKPVWRVLEDEFELVLANAAHVRNVGAKRCKRRSRAG